MMKKITLFLIFTHVLFANEKLLSIYDNILLKNSSNALNVSIEMKRNIGNDKVSKNLFKDLVFHWKKVEALYILGDLNSKYIDTPRFIDIFHQGNEDIKEQLSFILSKNTALEAALYKNSHKTINALEYVLFTQDLSVPRVKKMQEIIVATLEKNLKIIQQGYISEKENFIKDELRANTIILNTLVDSSYKLKEWRVGDPAGLSRKFKGKADNARAEYSLSKHSILAIQAILNTHKDIMAKQKFQNFGDIIETYGAKEELHHALKYIDKSLKALSNITNDDFSNAKDLYTHLKKLHITYYISLVDKLKITAKILEADGD